MPISRCRKREKVSARARVSWGSSQVSNMICILMVETGVGRALMIPHDEVKMHTKVWLEKYIFIGESLLFHRKFSLNFDGF